MNRDKIWVVILLGVCLLIMGAGPTEEQLALFRQLDAKPVAELKNEGLAQYLAARTVIQNATSRPSAGEMVAACARKQMGCKVAVPSRTEDLTSVHCVSIVNRSLAMALAKNYDEYFILLSRIMFKNGVFSKGLCPDPIVDWVPNNEWALVEMTGKLGVTPVEVQAMRIATVRVEAPQSVPALIIPRQDIMKCADKIMPGDVVFIMVLKHYTTYDDKRFPLPTTTKDRVHYVYHQTIADRNQEGAVLLVSNWGQEVRGFSLSDLAEQAISKRPYIEGFKIFRVKKNAYQKAEERIAAYRERYTSNPLKTFPNPTPSATDSSIAAGKDPEGFWFGIAVKEFEFPRGSK